MRISGWTWILVLAMGGAAFADEPPACDQAEPSVSMLWPPNHRMIDVEILGITDPDGDALTVTITDITHNEIDAPGAGNTSPDWAGVGTSTASVRAERAGGGSGRVYTITFEATDPTGNSCTGSVDVLVPHDRRDQEPPTDSASLSPDANRLDLDPGVTFGAGRLIQSGKSPVSGAAQQTTWGNLKVLYR